MRRGQGARLGRGWRAGCLLLGLIGSIALLLPGAFGHPRAAAADAVSAAPVELREGDRIVWIGGTFVERMQQDNYLETFLSAAFPQKKLTFRNLGWSGDTVLGESRGVFGGPNEGFARLVKDVKETKPTVLVVQYGANEAYRGPDGVAPFVAGLQRLLDALADTKARVILVSPSPREKLPAPLPDPSRYNEWLKLYESAIRDVATKRGAAFVSLNDLFRSVPFPWHPPTAESTGSATRGFQFTENGLHFRPGGDQLAAAAMAAKFGAQFPKWAVAIDTKALKAEASGVRVEELKKTELGWSFLLVDQLGPLPPQYRGQLTDKSAAQQAEQREPRLTIPGLPPGKYALKIDGQSVATLTTDELAKGTDALAASRWKRAEQLRETIRVKNELYFHRHRPQNETYLFLFRKHEQGQNAVEIPQFDPLVAEKEKLIFELSQPVRQRVELSRVE